MNFWADERRTKMKFRGGTLERVGILGRDPKNSRN